MATIGRVIVDVIANTSKFVKGLAGAEGRLGRFRRSVKRFAAGAARQFARALAASTAALTALSIQGVRSGDQLAKTAQKLGIAAGELAGMRLAAEETGIATQQLDLGLQRMVRRIAEAAKGTGEAQQAIKDLGLDAMALARQAPEEQFRAVADSFELVGNKSERIRLGFKLFDSEAVGLINTLALGRDRLEEFTREAEQLGLVLKPTQLQNIQEAADAGGRVGKAFSGLGRQLGALFAPALTRAAEATTEWVASITQSLPKMAAFASAVFGISRAVDDLTLRETRAELAAVFNELVSAESKMLQVQRQVRESFEARGMVGESELEGVRRVTENFARLQLRSRALQGRLRELNQTTEQTGKSFSTFAGRDVQPFIDSIGRASDELDAFIQKQEDLEAFGQRVFQQTRTPIENFVSEMAQARESMRAGFLDPEAFQRFRQQWLENIVEPIEETSKASSKTFDEIRQASKQAARNIQDAFADFLFDPFAEGLRGMLKGFIDIVRRMLANQAATQLFSMISGAISPKLEPIDMSSLPKKLKGFQHGGSFTVGGSGGTDSQLVAFRATPGEPVAVGDRFVGRGGGGDINITNHISADGFTEAQLVAALNANSQRTIGELQRMRDKGRF